MIPLFLNKILNNIEIVVDNNSIKVYKLLVLS
jgi:hypothetical protein